MQLFQCITLLFLSIGPCSVLARKKNKGKNKQPAAAPITIHRFGSNNLNVIPSLSMLDEEDTFDIRPFADTDPTDFKTHFSEVYTSSNRHPRQSHLFMGLPKASFEINFTAETPTMVGFLFGSLGAYHIYQGLAVEYLVTTSARVVIVVGSYGFTIIFPEEIVTLKFEYPLILKHGIIFNGSIDAVVKNNSNIVHVRRLNGITGIIDDVSFTKHAATEVEDGHYQIRVQSTASYVVGIVLPETRKKKNSANQMFLSGFVSDGEHFWYNMNSGLDNSNKQPSAIHVRVDQIQGPTPEVFDIIVTVWKDGSETGLRLRLDAAQSRGWRESIWTVSEMEDPVPILGDSTSVEPMPESITQVCVLDSSCPVHQECNMTEADKTDFRPGVCEDAKPKPMPKFEMQIADEARLYSESHVVIYQDFWGNVKYEYNEIRLLPQNHPNLPDWFLHYDSKAEAERSAKDLHHAVTVASNIRETLDDIVADAEPVAIP